MISAHDPRLATESLRARGRSLGTFVGPEGSIDSFGSARENCGPNVRLHSKMGLLTTKPAVRNQCGSPFKYQERGLWRKQTRDPQVLLVDAILQVVQSALFD